MAGPHSRDPLSLLYELNSSLNRAFAYDAASTNVDSPIDEALKHRGNLAMGFDQDKTEHHFLLQRSGGAIVVTSRDAAAAQNHTRVATAMLGTTPWRCASTV